MDTEVIKDRLSIEEVVGEYVSLKPAGQHLKALCPFHQEKTPSFIVSPSRGTWHCFGCNTGGDIFTFVQQAEGVDFRSALKMLAERAGVELAPGSAQSNNRRQRLFDLMQGVARLYNEILMRQKAGSRAKKYLAERGIRENMMEHFQIGYAPHSWDATHTWLVKKGYTMDEITASGIAGRSSRGSYYDRFRGRIMFPIADVQGRVVAFGGRIVPWHETGNEGKYVNSPETELFEKRRVVYNLSRAKHSLRKKLPCIVVEGYMDVVMTVQSGIDNVVATSGTAFTEDHMRQLKRFTNELHFAFDADDAGWKATVSATQAALAAGMHVATVDLPKSLDPADIALKDPQELVRVMRTTKPLIAVLLDQLGRAEDVSSQEQQLEALLPLLSYVHNPIAQGEMIQQIADTLHVPEQKIIDAMSEHTAPLQQTIEDVQKVPSTEKPAVRSEHELLGLVILQQDARKNIFPDLQETYFLDPSCRMLYNDMERVYTSSPSFFSMNSDQLCAALDEQNASLVEGIKARAQELLSMTSNSPLQEGRLLMISLRKRFLRERLQGLQEEIARGGGVERIEEFQKIARELAGS